MYADIVFPNGNEYEFIRMASRLGIKKIYFAYEPEHAEKMIKGKKYGVIENDNVRVEIAIIVNWKNANKAKRFSKKLVVKSSEKAREFIDGKKADIIYGFEEFFKKDFLLQRASGLNHSLCELARNKNVSIGFNYSSLIGKRSDVLPKTIGRMIQNIRLCEKYGARAIIASFSSEPFMLRPHFDVMNLFSFLGMSRPKVKNSLEF